MRLDFNVLTLIMYLSGNTGMFSLVHLKLKYKSYFTTELVLKTLVLEGGLFRGRFWSRHIGVMGRRGGMRSRIRRIFLNFSLLFSLRNLGIR